MKLYRIDKVKMFANSQATIPWLIEREVLVEVEQCEFVSGVVHDGCGYLAHIICDKCGWVQDPHGCYAVYVKQEDTE